MVLSEICSSSFLFSVAIIIILVGGLFAYFNHRFSVQNHKISSMMGLVTTMAEEMQYFRSRISGKSEQDVHADTNANQIHIIPQFLGGQSDLNNLIEVSDGEDDEDEDEDNSESDEESEEESDSESESDEEESDDEESDEEESDDESKSGDQIKNISIDLGNEIDLNIDNEFINVDESIDKSIDESIEECVETKTINLSEDISSFEISSKTLENIHDIDISIQLTNDYADSAIHSVDKDKVDYKKMSINKLREVAVEKGLVVDASKLKKNDILKLLGAEQ